MVRIRHRRTWRNLFIKIVTAASTTWILVQVISDFFPNREDDSFDNASLMEIKKYSPKETKFEIHETRCFEITKKPKKIAQKFLDKRVTVRFKPPPNIFGDNTGLGGFGVPVKMPLHIKSDIKSIVDDGWKNHQFNQYLSDLISVNRTLPDRRTEYCKKIAHDSDRRLPATSVIIIFHNEAWSTLLRSVHSVLNRSPEHLITEVILVDDFSTMGK